MIRTAQVLRRLSFQDWGGTESVVWETSKRLVRADVGVEILATQALCATAEETVDGLHIRRYPYYYPNFPMGAARKLALDGKGGSPYSPALRKVLEHEPFDLIHLHAMGRIAQMALAVAQKRRIPCVLSLHGGALNVPQAEQATILAPTKGTFPYGNLLDRVLGYRKDLLRAVDGVICVGEDEAEAMRARGMEALYLPNGVDTAAFSAASALSADAVRARWSIPATDKIALCAARIDAQKNQRLLVQWLARRRAAGEAVHLVLAGPVTTPSYGEALRALIDELGVAAHVTLTGALGHGSPELLGLYHAAEAFLLASQHEPFGIVALEAWAAGVPLIAARVGGLGRLMSPGRTALAFEPGDLDGLEQAWCELEGSSARRDSLIAAARAEVAAYDWAQIVTRLEGFYARLIESKARNS